MSYATRFSALVAAAAFLLPSVARADDARVDGARKKAAALYPECTKKPSEADLKGAKGAHTAAKQFLELGRYDKAIASWNDAYTFDCSRPTVFYNLSNAYERNGDKPMTIAVLELAIARDPEADKATLQAKVDNLKSSIAAEPVVPAPVDKPPVTAAPVEKSAPIMVTRRPFGPAPWITLAVGGAALVAGIPVLIIGRGKVADAKDACPTHSHCSAASASTGNTGNTMTGAGVGLLAAGGAVAIGSLIWQLAGNSPRSVPQSQAKAGIDFVPAVSPSLAGAVVSGRF